MKKVLKIRAFTVIELIMTLLISSVVIGIVFYAYLLFNNQFTRYQQKSISIDEFVIFQKALQTDLESAGVVKNIMANEIACYNGVNDKIVQYNFNSNFIIRSFEENLDSFEIKNSGCQAGFVNDHSDLVEKLIVNITIANVPFNAIFKKQYSACQLMKQEHTDE